MALNVTTIRGWHKVALDLNAIDHSIGEMRARAVGPCASAYALGLASAALADATAHATSAHYGPAIALQGPNQPIIDVNKFVGGAIYEVLEHIFTDRCHKDRLARGEADLPSGGTDWGTGRKFGEQLSRRWNANEVQARINPEATDYQIAQGKHAGDPLNPTSNPDGRNFYGQSWAGATRFVSNPTHRDSIAPLALRRDQLNQAYQPLASPPPEGSPRFNASVQDVQRRGRLPSDINDNGPRGDQLRVGTFWAYDGATGIGTPPRLYNQLVAQIIDESGRQLDAEEWARLLGLINLAMANASIVAWRGKYEHAYQRPVEWIRQRVENGWEPLGSPRSMRPLEFPCEAAFDGAQDGRDAQALVGADQRPSFTPNFPAYPSGHATFGGACFAALRGFLDSSQLNGGRQVELRSDELDRATTDPFTKSPRPDEPVKFATTDELMSANSQSRIDLGVHWDFDGTDGNAAGVIIGELIVGSVYT